MIRNMLRFHGEELLASPPTPKLEYSPVEMWWHTVTPGKGSEGETGEWIG